MYFIIDLLRARIPRQPVEGSSPTWRAFLANHVPSLVSIDFFTVPTVRNRILYVFVVLAHLRRRIVHFNVTEHPTSDWTSQQMIEAFPWDTAPRYMIRDRDGIYGASCASTWTTTTRHVATCRSTEMRRNTARYNRPRWAR